jgi:hypothetical protein
VWAGREPETTVSWVREQGTTVSVVWWEECHSILWSEERQCVCVNPRTDPVPSHSTLWSEERHSTRSFLHCCAGRYKPLAASPPSLPPSPSSGYPPPAPHRQHTGLARRPARTATKKIAKNRTESVPLERQLYKVTERNFFDNSFLFLTGADSGVSSMYVCMHVCIYI